ncbi:MAG: metal ABC transporter permease [Candidatus Schekmanbacteria bacterium]|nr:metal ABC transporter permease [Candidatus Schekmanbacteria bacterium]
MAEIFQFDFMIRAFIAGIAVAVIAPLIGLFLVVRRYSLMSDTLAHISLLGVTIGFLTNISPLLMAVLLASCSAFGMEKLRSHKKFSGDAILSLFLSGSLALAVIMISFIRGLNVNLLSFLFGSISTVSVNDLYFIVSLCLLVLATITGFYKELFLVSLDEELAAANGIKIKTFNLTLIILAAISVSLSIKIVGALLIGALMTIPVMTAIQFRCSFRETLLLSILFSLLSVVSGLFLSYYLGWASGGTIVIVALLIFLLSLVAEKIR